MSQKFIVTVKLSTLSNTFKVFITICRRFVINPQLNVRLYGI